MRSRLSIIALVAALCLVTPALAAGVSVNAGTSTEVSAGAGAASVEAGAQTSASADAMTSSSSAADTSSAMASSMSSSQAPGSQDCANTQVGTAAIDATALAAVTNVTVFKLSDCASVPTIGTIDGSAQAALQTNAAVQAAITASGDAGAQVVGYTMDGTSLTVYVTN